MKAECNIFEIYQLVVVRFVHWRLTLRCLMYVRHIWEVCDNYRNILAVLGRRSKFFANKDDFDVPTVRGSLLQK